MVVGTKEPKEIRKQASKQDRNSLDLVSLDRSSLNFIISVSGTKNAFEAFFRPPQSIF